MRRFTTHALARGATLALAALTLTGLGASTALAAPPQHSGIVAPAIEFGPGDACAGAVRFENLVLRGLDTHFGPTPAGDVRVLSRGSGISRVTNLETGAMYEFQGGVRFLVVYAEDGSFRVDASGRDFVVWYHSGDAADLGPGFYQVSGTATEWYASDGSFLRATHSGSATDLCEAVGA